MRWCRAAEDARQLEGGRSSTERPVQDRIGTAEWRSCADRCTPLSEAHEQWLYGINNEKQRGFAYEWYSIPFTMRSLPIEYVLYGNLSSRCHTLTSTQILPDHDQCFTSDVLCGGVVFCFTVNAEETVDSALLLSRLAVHRLACDQSSSELCAGRDDLTLWWKAVLLQQISAREREADLNTDSRV